MRSGVISGLDVSSHLVLERDDDGLLAAVFDDEEAYFEVEGDPVIPDWALSPEDRQARWRAEAQRRLELKQDPGCYDDLLGRSFVVEDDPAYLVDGVPDRHANEVNHRTLQREVRVEGGGGKSSGRTKSMVLKRVSEDKRPGREFLGNRYVDKVLFQGVTRGQLVSYRMNPDIQIATEAMLVAVSESVRAGALPPDVSERPKPIVPGKKVIVLNVGDLELARHYRTPVMRGVALLVLSETIARIDGGRAARLDAMYAAEKAMGKAA
jgi:hypothetical protein